MTKSDDVVRAAWFREAQQRVTRALPTPAQTVRVRGITLGLVQPLASGVHTQVYLAQRLGVLPERVILKLAPPDDPACTDALKAAAHALDTLQQSQAAGAPYFTQRLPQTVLLGTAHSSFFTERPALVLRAPPGYWGSLAQVLDNYRNAGQSIDARHAVWMWRRVLEVLAFVHASGWVHQDLQPENLLVHPANHGIRFVGWSQARASAHDALRGRDLAQIAWTVRCLLCGGADPATRTLPAQVPAPLVRLLQQCESPAWCAQQGAQGLDQALRQAAREAFGPPQFIHFHPQP